MLRRGIKRDRARGARLREDKYVEARSEHGLKDGALEGAGRASPDGGRDVPREQRDGAVGAPRHRLPEVLPRERDRGRLAEDEAHDGVRVAARCGPGDGARPPARPGKDALELRARRHVLLLREDHDANVLVVVQRDGRGLRSAARNGGDGEQVEQPVAVHLEHGDAEHNLPGDWPHELKEPPRGDHDRTIHGLRDPTLRPGPRHDRRAAPPARHLPDQGP